jgi:hypothetical protein
MFKRVDRRRKRKENEERLGLDEEVFGLYHTDSSESESDSSDSASTSSSSDGYSTQSRKKRKRGSSPPSYDKSGEDEDGEPAIDDEEDEEGSIDRGHPSLTIASALKEPIRLILPDSEVWVCVFCPGKTLKHAAMVKVHEASRVSRLQSQRSHCTQELSHRFTGDVSSACRSSRWNLVRRKTFKTYLQNQRRKHSPKQTVLFCRTGRKRGCVETLHASSF